MTDKLSVSMIGPPSLAIGFLRTVPLDTLCESLYLAKWDRSNCARRRQKAMAGFARLSAEALAKAGARRHLPRGLFRGGVGRLMPRRQTTRRRPSFRPQAARSRPSAARS